MYMNRPACRALAEHAPVGHGGGGRDDLYLSISVYTCTNLLIELEQNESSHHGGGGGDYVYLSIYLSVSKYPCMN